jgi:drug/metabolite transporter (DMT)-like permease
MKAARMLLLATVLWGLSFPVMKALGLDMQQLLPGASTWFLTASAVIARFGLATVIMALCCRRTLRQITRLEVWQGAGLAFFGGAGLLFQMDGLAYTSASTSAFLTQCYCLILPFAASIRDRKPPSLLMIGCSLMVVAGVAILADVDWRTLRLGRGEIETLIGSFLFTGQILWLERPQFARNRVGHFSLVMFAGTVLVCLPVGLWHMERAADWITPYLSPEVIVYVAILVLFCTMGAYLLMNYWQPFIPAEEAGLVYAAEPVAASLFALFLPAWLSAFSGISYPNEQVTRRLVVGGGLISAANLLLQTRRRTTARPASPPQPELLAG